MKLLVINTFSVLIVLTFCLSGCGVISNNDKTEIVFNSTLQKDKVVIEHLRKYHEGFHDFYKDVYDDLEGGNFFKFFTQLGSVFLDAPTLFAIENSHEKIIGSYKENIVELILLEEKKINILINYTYYEHVQMYKKGSTFEKDEKKRNKYFHPRFLHLRLIGDDKSYKNYVQDVKEAMRVIEDNLVNLRHEKAIKSLFYDKENNYESLVKELKSLINNDFSNENMVFSEESRRLGFEKFNEVINGNYEFMDMIDEYWSDEKKSELEYFKNSIRFYLLWEIEFINKNVNLDYQYKDFLKHGQCSH